MHGGMSTGPRTAAGLERSRRNWKHGRYSAEAIQAHREAAYETVEQGRARCTLEATKADSATLRKVRFGIRALNRLLR